jgi:hypothetical protein
VVGNYYLDDGAHASEGSAFERLAPVEGVAVFKQPYVIPRDGLDQVLGCVLEVHGRGGGREGRREGGREGGREGRKEGRRKGGREGGREGAREGGLDPQDSRAVPRNEGK